MGGFFSVLWGIYTGLLTILGNAILVFFGIGLCAYAMVQQLGALHSNALDTVFFAIGISLVAFAFVRRMVWTYAGLLVPWLVLVAAGLYLVVQDEHRFDVLSLPVLAIVFLPPALGAMILALLPKVEMEEIAPHLEITLAAPIDGMSIEGGALGLGSEGEGLRSKNLPSSEGPPAPPYSRIV